MSKAISLHIGLNSVDPDHYQGWSGELAACEFDAQDMSLIAKSSGFTDQIMLTKTATRDAVKNAIKAAANALKSGDMFFLTYSGHGGQVPDTDGDESDGEDETWCLFDGELVDDEIYAYLGGFTAGVRILVLSDSCHSGSVLRQQRLLAVSHMAAAAMIAPPRYRAMPPEVAQRTYLANREFYDRIGRDPEIRGSRAKVRASALLISGCQDNQLSSDGTFNGLFTAKLKTVWNGGKFKGNYRRFHSDIVKQMPMDQTPNYYFVGAGNTAFEEQKPFTV